MAHGADPVGAGSTPAILTTKEEYLDVLEIPLRLPDGRPPGKSAMSSSR